MYDTGEIMCQQQKQTAVVGDVVRANIGSGGGGGARKDCLIPMTFKRVSAVVIREPTSSPPSARGADKLVRVVMSRITRDDPRRYYGNVTNFLVAVFLVFGFR